MDICHLKNAELEAKHQKYKGRVVLRGDIVKDDSGSYAVFTEQGSSASQMTAAEVMDVISRLPGCAGQVADAETAYTQVKHGRCTDVIVKQSQNVQIFGYVYQNTSGPNHGPVWKIRSFLQSEIFTVIRWQDYYGKSNSRKFYFNTLGKKFQIGNAYSLTEKKGYSCLCMWTRHNWLETNKTMKDVDLGEPTSFLDHVYLGCTQRECQISKDIVDNYRKMFESRISAWALDKLPVSAKSDANISSWSYDMEGHAKKCVERYCELANKTTQQLYRVSTPCLDDHQFKEKDMGSVGELSTVCTPMVLKC